MRQFIKTKTFRIAAVVALLLGLYAIAGFVLAPKLARNALLTDIPKTLVGVTPTVGDVITAIESLLAANTRGVHVRLTSPFDLSVFRHAACIVAMPSPATVKRAQTRISSAERA